MHTHYRAMIGSAPRLRFIDPTHVAYRTRSYLFFGGCDYFRLAWHPRILQALKRKFASNFPLSIGASRLTTGNHESYSTLEVNLARFFRTEACVLTSSGYLSNLVAAQGLRGLVTHGFMDEGSHGSLREAALSLNVPVQIYPHGDITHLRRLVQQSGAFSKPIVLTDGLFAHDGRIADVPALLRLVKRRGWILLDDAHGAFLLGQNGRGVGEGVHDPFHRIITTISLSKAMGVFGGAVLCSNLLRDRITQHSRAFAGSTPIPIPLVEAANQALEILKLPNGPRESLLRVVQSLREQLTQADITLPLWSGPAMFIRPASNDQTERIRRTFLKHGIWPPYIRYPGLKQGNYFRIVLSNAHSTKELAVLVECFKALWKQSLLTF